MSVWTQYVVMLKRQFIAVALLLIIWQSNYIVRFLSRSNHRSAFIKLNALKLDKDGRNVFFVAAVDGDEIFPDLELCAFESASKHNSEKTVFVLLSDESTVARPPDYFKDISNVHFVKADYSQVFDGTPVAELWESGKVHKSNYRHVHTSDLLRQALLYKFGGTYFDSDVISMRPIPELENFIVLEDPNYAVGTILKFRRGHPFMNESLTILGKDFNPNTFNDNGPYLVTRVAKEFFCTENKTFFEQRECKENLTLLLPNTAYAINYPGWTLFYDESKYEVVQGYLEASFAFHIWNSMKKFQKIEPLVRTDHPIYRLAEEHCPLTVENVLEHNIGRPYGSRLKM